MDYYELAEETQVYPEWTSYRLVFQGRPAPIAGAASLNASLSRADELMVFCEFTDFVPDDVSERVKPEGTYRTTHYRRVRTQAGRFVGFTARHLMLSDDTLDDMTLRALDEATRTAHLRRPTLRVNDGFMGDWHDDFGTELIR